MQEPQEMNVEAESTVIDLIDQEPSKPEYVPFNPFVAAAQAAMIEKIINQKKQVQCELLSEDYVPFKNGAKSDGNIPTTLMRVYKDPTIWASGNKYSPHQGKKEIARRLAKLEKVS